MKESNIKRDALISKDKKHRYSLKRIWDDKKPKVLFIMLNPSLANSDQDDPIFHKETPLLNAECALDQNLQHVPFLWQDFLIHP